MLNILLVEDDQDLSDITRTYLTHAGYNIDTAFNYAEAKAYIDSTDYDLILLDIMLPDRNGDELCMEVRSECNCPIIFLSCLEDSGTIVNALRSGGDDYMVKPIKFPELLARVEAVTRRVSPKKSDPVRTFKSFTIDTARHKITRSGDEIILSSTEYGLLLYMINHPDTLLLYQELYQNVWNSDSLGDFRTVMVHVSNLCKKIDPEHTGIISTVRGTGYIFSDI